MNILAELVAKITADTTELKKGLSDAENSVQSWADSNSKQLKIMGGVLTGVGAAITASLGMMTNAAVDEEVGIKRLSVVLRGVGADYDFVRESLEGLIKSIQRKTGIADSEQREALGRLILVTKDYNTAVSLLPLALDLAAAGQMNTSTAATYLGKAWQELAAGADSISIRLGYSSVQFKNLAELESFVGGSAEEMASPLQQLKVIFDDLAEAIGAGLLPTLKRFTDFVIPIIEGITQWTDAHPALTQAITILAGVIGGFMVVAGGLLLLLPVLAVAAVAFGGSMTSILPIILIITAALVALAAIIMTVTGGWGELGNLFSMGKPAIPQMASGGIVTRPTMALIGEAGPEAIVPLNEMNQGITINVAGSVVTERDLLAFIRKGLYQDQGRNFSLGLT